MNDHEDPYVSALRALAEKYGPEKVALSISQGSPSGALWTVQMRSRNPNAAPLSVLMFSSGLVLLVAGFSQTELAPSKGYGEAQQIAEIIELCEAVLEGKFEEVVVSSGERVLSTRGTFYLRSRPFKSFGTKVSWRWLTHRSRRAHRYEAFT